MTQVTPRFKVVRERKTAKEKREGMSQAYLAKIRQLPSCVSGISPVEAHHLRISGRGSRKAPDKFAVPLTPEEHREIHREGSRKEEAWFRARGIKDVRALTKALWMNQHDVEAMKRVLVAHWSQSEDSPWAQT